MNPIVKNGNKLRWKFESIKDLTNDGLSSDKFHIEPIDWRIKIGTRILNEKQVLAVLLQCDSNNKHNKNWICEVEATLRLLKPGGDKKNLEAKLAGARCFHHDSEFWGIPRFLSFSNLLMEKNGYLVDDSIVIEVDFNFRYYDFSKQIPNVTDITINVEDTEFHLNKWALGSRSKYFYELILNSKPKELESIKLDDVKAKHFCYMLASLYPFFDANIGNNIDFLMLINIQYLTFAELWLKNKNYVELIEMARKFEVSSLHHICEQFLINDMKLEVIDKIKLDDENDYEKLMKTCIDSLANGLDVKKLRFDAKFSELKDSTKLRVMDRSLDFF